MKGERRACARERGGARWRACPVNPARVTGADHSAVLARWARGVREVQTDPASGLVIQRLDARTGFALAPLRAFGHPEAFTRVYRRPNPRVRALPRSPERGSRNARRAPRVS